jgi:dihydrolipoamide dehydrogenase
MVVGELTENTEVAVIGSGVGGYVAAIRLAQLGKEVILVSKDALPGGTCLLHGCIPSKALIEATKFYRKIEAAKVMGIYADNPRMNFTELQAWKQQIVEKMAKGTQQLLKQNGVQYAHGEAFFQDDHTLEVRGEHGNQKLRFEHAVLAPGSLPKPLKNFEYDGELILSSKEALALTEVPPSLLVIGGGYIGLELGTVYARLGSQVTLVEATDNLLPGLDPDLLRPVKKKLKEMNITVHLETLAELVKKSGRGVEVALKSKESKTKLQVHKVLVAVGRFANTQGYGLENLKVKMSQDGFIATNERCQTSIPHLYAVGDATGGMMLAHKAGREARVAAAHIAGQQDAFDNPVPAVIFTEPEIAYVGLQEHEAQNQGLEIETGTFGFAALARAFTMNEAEGFVKVVAEKNTQRILGVQIVGPHASDLITEATLGIEMGALLEDLAVTIHPHPTLSEAIGEAVEATLGMAIHRYQKR